MLGASRIRSAPPARKRTVQRSAVEVSGLTRHGATTIVARLVGGTWGRALERWTSHGCPHRRVVCARSLGRRLVGGERVRRGRASGTEFAGERRRCGGAGRADRDGRATRGGHAAGGRGDDFAGAGSARGGGGEVAAGRSGRRVADRSCRDERRRAGRPAVVGATRGRGGARYFGSGRQLRAGRPAAGRVVGHARRHRLRQDGDGGGDRRRRGAATRLHRGAVGRGACADRHPRWRRCDARRAHELARLPRLRSRRAARPPPGAVCADRLRHRVRWRRDVGQRDEPAS
jgi:hypothetical protein